MVKTNKIIVLLFIFLAILLSSCAKKDKCANVNCNDNNPCTIDICNPGTGLCSNTLKSCPEGNICNKNTGQCESTISGLNKIESAISKKIPAQQDKMTAIEQAIKNKLS